ncbi:hypothetical protein TWF481_011735 [Arthrobotrys musiformis]|uniref:C2H2-type domain-containing protein n=1 Tax=Arthrobotrys musiformis TaxID=47236 RepID=A0AAV9W567_9PEZI
MWTRHKFQAFKCPNCDKRVSRFDNLKIHQERCKGLHSIGDKRSASPYRGEAESPGKSEKRYKAGSLNNTVASRVGTCGSAPPDTQNDGDNQDIPPRSSSPGSSSDGDSQEVSLLVVEVRTLKEELQKSSSSIAVLRDKVSKLVLECDLWKQNYLQLKLQDKMD